MLYDIYMLRRLRWYIPRFFLTLLMVWIIFLAGGGYYYVVGLTRPGCPPIPDQRTGYQRISLTTSDGLQLAGWYRPPQNGVIVILLAGNANNRDSMHPEAAVLERHGYGTLLPDLRQCAGRYGTLGAKEIVDLRAAVDYARAQPGVRRVAALGFSIGAVTVVRGAARFTDIDAVIAMGDYYNMWGEITATGDAPLSPRGQLKGVICLMIWLIHGVWPPSISPIDDLPKIAPRPVLLIHGQNEAPRSRAIEQFAAAGEPKELWVVPGVGHGGYLSREPEVFENRVVGFLDRYLLP